MANNDYATALNADQAFANEHGIDSTPTMFVNSVKLAGAVPAEQILTIIRQLQERAQSEKPRDISTSGSELPVR